MNKIQITEANKSDVSEAIKNGYYRKNNALTYVSKQIIFFNKELEQLEVIGNALAVIWNHKFKECGDFEIHVLLNKRNKEICQYDNVVWIKGERTAGIIDTIKKINGDISNVSKIVIKGKTQQVVLSWRILWGTNNYTGYLSDIIYDAIDSHMINPVVYPTDRKLDILSLSDGKPILGPSLSIQRTGTNIKDFVENMCETYGLGYEVVFDYANKKIIFAIVQGADRTVGNADNNRACIFSTSMSTLMNSSYELKGDSVKSFALVAGEGEGADRKIVEVGGGSGVDRREIYVDARDLQSDSNPDKIIPEHEYLEMLAQRGESVLGENIVFESIAGNIVVDSNIKYGVDYFLGDKVTIIDEDMGLSMNSPITAVQEAWSGSKYSIVITFGDAPLTIMKKVRKQVL